MARVETTTGFKALLASILAALGLLSAGGYMIVALLLLAIGEPKPSAAGAILYFAAALAASGCAVAAILSVGQAKSNIALIFGTISVTVIPAYIFVFLR